MIMVMKDEGIREMERKKVELSSKNMQIKRADDKKKKLNMIGRTLTNPRPPQPTIDSSIPPPPERRTETSSSVPGTGRYIHTYKHT